ncbi:MAG: hypothetical protein HQM11_18620 [SAR324 cluster bacterium]|nr:hypothetical protein [SAR324 cluster bacterium]
MLYLIFLAGIGWLKWNEIQLYEQYQKLALGSVTFMSEDLSMKAAYLLWMAGCVLEVFYLKRPYYPGLGGFMLLVWFFAFFIRIRVMDTLKQAANAIQDNGHVPLNQGPYRFIRYPHHVCLILEIFCVPLLHSAWITAFLGTVIMGRLIWKNVVELEESGISAHAENPSSESLPRFIPRIRKFSMFS